jgi:predicted metallopeptidase
MMALYIDHEQVQVRVPDVPDIEERLYDMELNHIFSTLTERLFQTLYDQREHIMTHHTAELQGISATFTSDMRLHEIKSNDYSVSFIYDRNGELIEIKALAPVIRNLSFQVQRMEHENITISPIW